jgi:membrane-associated HD superfamily phosphohydrolase
MHGETVKFTCHHLLIIVSLSYVCLSTFLSSCHLIFTPTYIRLIVSSYIQTLCNVSSPFLFASLLCNENLEEWDLEGKPFYTTRLCYAQFASFSSSNERREVLASCCRFL